MTPPEFTKSIEMISPLLNCGFPSLIPFLNHRLAILGLRKVICYSSCAKSLCLRFVFLIFLGFLSKSKAIGCGQKENFYRENLYRPHCFVSHYLLYFRLDRLLAESTPCNQHCVSWQGFCKIQLIKGVADKIHIKFYSFTFNF